MVQDAARLYLDRFQERQKDFQVRRRHRAQKLIVARAIELGRIGQHAHNTTPVTPNKLLRESNGSDGPKVAVRVYLIEDLERMILDWLHAVAIVSLIAGLICAVWIALDEIRHPQRSTPRSSA
jgi:hypothetical protein